MDYRQYIGKKYPYINDTDAEVLIGKSKEMFFNIKYPYRKPELRPTEVPENYKYWITSCIDEIIARDGTANAISYSENGISFNFDRSDLSLGLVNQIVPEAGSCR